MQGIRVTYGKPSAQQKRDFDRVVQEAIAGRKPKMKNKKGKGRR